MFSTKDTIIPHRARRYLIAINTCTPCLLCGSWGRGNGRGGVVERGDNPGRKESRKSLEDGRSCEE